MTHSFPTLRSADLSIGKIGRRQRGQDNDADFVAPIDMLRELTADNRAYVESLRRASDICDQAGDTATASLIDNWLDEAEERVWFLFETSRGDRKSTRLNSSH